MLHKLEIVREFRREYRRFGSIGTQLTVRLNLPSDPNPNPVEHFQASMNDLF
jgi:hypothetical protein